MPEIIAFRVEIGTRFPATTSQGKVLLASLGREDLEWALTTPSRSHVKVNRPLSGAELEAEFDTVRDLGWALADEELAPGIRSIAAPVREESGEVHSTVNVTVHAAETSRGHLLNEHLPQLLKTASEISEDWARWRRRPHVELDD